MTDQEYQAEPTYKSAMATRGIVCGVSDLLDIRPISECDLEQLELAHSVLGRLLRRIREEV